MTGSDLRKLAIKKNNTEPQPPAPKGRVFSSALAYVGDGEDDEDEILRHHLTLLELDGSERLMIFVDAWFDESDTFGSNATFTVVAGFAGFSVDWLPFSNLWNLVLQSHPSIEYFHSVEANNRTCQFKGWSKPVRDKKVIALIDVIRDAKPQPLLSVVRRDAYEKLLTEFPGAMPEDSYIFCIYNLILDSFHLGESIRRNAKDNVKVSLNFEDNKAMRKKAEKAYWIALRDYSPMQRILSSTVSYLPKKKFKPLQAADALAYDYGKEYSAKEKNPEAKMRRSLEAIIERVKPLGFLPWTYERLKPLFEERFNKINSGGDDE